MISELCLNLWLIKLISDNYGIIFVSTDRSKGYQHICEISCQNLEWFLKNLGKRFFVFFIKYSPVDKGIYRIKIIDLTYLYIGSYFYENLKEFSFEIVPSKDLIQHVSG